MTKLLHFNKWYLPLLIVLFGGFVKPTNLHAQSTLPEGALNGLFSVSENTQVRFSQGNLQYKASTNTWRFAANQYDYIGDANSSISSTYSNYIDLFGWGTSGYNHGSVCYQPWSTSTSYSDYYAYGSLTYNLFDQTGKADWGYNAISNGGNQENSGWRTLTRAEWLYLFDTRSTPSGIRYAKANVNGVNGVILLPDDWQSSYYSLSSTNTSGASFSSNTITASQWTTLEQHGAVFLPAAGRRSGTSVSYVGSSCNYWSSSCNNSNYAWDVYIDNLNVAAATDYHRYIGHSVRLVIPSHNGALNGVFSVRDGYQVNFSQGNLQYKASTNTWRFAENQYDYIGDANSNISSTYSDYIDLFGWGTSGYNHGAICYQPWSTSTSSSDYYAYGSYTYNLYDQTGKADWGYNAISNGGNQEHSGWRTLTHEEWVYLFDTRSTPSGIRYAKAKVNNVSGVILLPDEWQSSYYSLSKTNSSSASFTSNTITATQWTTLEQHGAVFLPAAGYRYGPLVGNAGSYGVYWSSSYNDSDYAWDVYFGGSTLFAGTGDGRFYGRSVRLVFPSQIYSFAIDASPSPAEGGAVSGAGTYSEGAECTLIATASAGYHFVNWTENGTEVSTIATYTFTVTGDRTLVANFANSSSTSHEGALNGVFSVRDGYQVYFSQGNLQYKASTNTWRFAENQYDYIGDANSSISSTYSNYIDLFCWGTSGYNHGSVCYQPWSTSISNSDYYAYGSATYSLFDQTGKADWGYNAISNGGNQQNSGWRTLTNNEWEYLFNTRTTSSGIRYAKAKVNNVNGVILLPDDWQSSYYSLSSTNTSSASFSSNTITASQWATLEQHGAAFLPAAGFRDGTSVYFAGSYGCYWSSSYYDSGRARGVDFNDSGLYAGSYYNRYDGPSVRLVFPSQGYSFGIDASPSPAEGGAVSGAGTYSEGAECTLIATASAGYHFVNWTENGTEVSTIATYTFRVTRDRTLVANFAPNTYTVTLNTNNGTINSGNVTSYTYGVGATLPTNVTRTGYTFGGWYANSGLTGTAVTSISTTATGDKTFWAKWTINSYTIGASANPTAGGTVSGAGSYNYGASCTLVATPATGYSFVNWTSGNSQVSTNASYQFTVTGARTLVANFAPNTYTVTLNTNNGTINSGNVTSYTYGVGATLPTNVTRTGYTFGGWYDNANLSGTAVTSISTTATGDKTFWAKWTINSYAIGASANPTAGGTVSGAGFYNYGASCTLTATPATGYNFTKWTKNGTQVSTSASYTFTVNGAATYVAQFTKKTYTIAATANPTAGGTITGAGTYEHGASCTLVATPATGYSFVNWTSGNSEVSTNASYQFTVTGARTLVANFAPNTYTVTLNTNDGTINSGDVTSYTYGEGATLPTDVTRTGYTFGGWYDNANLTGTAVTSISATATGNKTFWAKWTINSYTIGASANPTAGGTVSGAGSYNYGASCTLVATPATGYNFTKWTKNNSQVSTSASYTFTVTEAANYVAVFTKKTYSIAATANPTAGGSITGAGTYEHGASCTLVATPATGYHFVNWTQNGSQVSTNASYQFTVTGAKTLVANFAPNTYTVTLNTNDGTINSGNVTSYTYGVGATLPTNVTRTGYTFGGWYDNANLSGTAVTSISTTATGNKTFWAKWTINSYAIGASANPEAGGTVSGAGTYNYGASCTLTATAAEGYTFVNWTENGNEVSSDATFQFTVTGTRSLVANFSLNSYDITATANPAVGGTVNGAGTFNHGETCSLTATAAEGYTFVNWTENGTEVSADATFQFTVTGTRSLVANFSLNSYAIAASANPNNGGTVTGANTYNHGETATLTATAAEGYSFVNWTEGTQAVSTNATYSFTVTDARTLVANFSINSYTLTVNYKYADGTTAAATHTEIVNYNATYTVASPEIMGYTADQLVVTGTMGAENVTVDVTYAINSYIIMATANPIDGGTISGTGTYNHGSSCVLTAIPERDYIFQRWTEDGVEVSTDATYSFVVTTQRNLVAHFAQIDYHWDEPHGYSGSMSFLGVVKIDGEVQYNANLELGAFVGTECRGRTLPIFIGNYCIYSLDIVGNTNGDAITLKLYDHLQQEELDLYCTNDLVFADGAYYGTDSFYEFNFVSRASITATADPVEGGSVSGMGDYFPGLEATLTATAAMGYTFVNWTLDGVVVSSYAGYTFVVSGPASYVAHFSLNSYDITASVNPAESGSVTGGGTYNHFASCTLTATANTGFTFQNWTLNGQEVSTETEYTFEVNGSGDYVANFSLNSYEITATADPAEGGSIEGAGTYDHFSTCILTAVAATGYTFVNWTLDGAVVSTNPIYTFEVDGGADYVAHFVHNYSVTASAYPIDGGIVSGAGSYPHLATCTLTATAAEGFQFNSWVVDGEVVETNPEYTFVVSGPVHAIAMFDLVQTVELNEGWTWWGTSVEVSGIENGGLSMLEESLNPNGRVIKSHSKSVQYQTQLGYWVGQLKSLNNEEGFRVQTVVPCSSTLVGPVANPEDHPITIDENWTWIGYPVSHTQTVTDALGNFEPEVNDIIKSQGSFARYLPSGWVPATFTLNPGESYLYYSKASGNKTLVYADNGNTKVVVEDADRYWNNNIHEFADNLNLLAVVNLGGMEQRDENLELGAFVNGECRGSAKLMYVEPFDRYYAMMNVMGEEGDLVEFAVVNTMTGEISDESSNHFTFATNAIIGEFDDPFVVSFGPASVVERLSQVSLYPNPINRDESFNLLIPQDETVVELSIINAWGSIVRCEKGVLLQHAVEGLPVAGVYLVKVICRSGHVYHGRLVVE